MGGGGGGGGGASYNDIRYRQEINNQLIEFLHTN